MGVGDAPFYTSSPRPAVPVARRRQAAPYPISQELTLPPVLLSLLQSPLPLMYNRLPYSETCHHCRASSSSPPYLYNAFVSQLTTHKHDVIVADLPSVSGKTAASITDDAQVIQAMTNNVADEGKDIILIMHSYDGVTKKERDASGKKGGVAALLYVTAFLVGPRKLLRSTMGKGAGVPDCFKVEVCSAFASILYIIPSSANLVFHSVFSLALYPS